MKINSFKAKVSFDFVPLSVFTAYAICLLSGFFFSPGWDFSSDVSSAGRGEEFLTTEQHCDFPLSKTLPACHL